VVVEVQLLVEVGLVLIELLVELLPQGQQIMQSQLVVVVQAVIQMKSMAAMELILVSLEVQFQLLPLVEVEVEPFPAQEVVVSVDYLGPMEVQVVEVALLVMAITKLEVLAFLVKVMQVRPPLVSHKNHPLEVAEEQDKQAVLMV
jgi:hypothetical protein